MENCIDSICTPRLVYLIALGVCFLIGVFFVKHSKPEANILPLLMAGLITETVIEILRYKNLLIASNELKVYNSYIRLEYIFYILYFWSAFKNSRLRKTVVFSSLIFLVVIMIESLTIGSGIGFYKWTYVTGGILASTWAIILLFIIQPVPDVKIVKLPLFWISFAIIIFYAGMLPFNVLYNDLFHDKSFELLNQIIPKTFNIIFFLLISTAFICSYRLRRS